jgi:hypothetical protein
MLKELPKSSSATAIAKPGQRNKGRINIKRFWEIIFSLYFIINKRKPTWKN